MNSSLIKILAFAILTFNAASDRIIPGGVRDGTRNRALKKKTGSKKDSYSDPCKSCIEKYRDLEYAINTFNSGGTKNDALELSICAGAPPVAFPASTGENVTDCLTVDVNQRIEFNLICCGKGSCTIDSSNCAGTTAIRINGGGDIRIDGIRFKGCGDEGIGFDGQDTNGVASTIEIAGDASVDPTSCSAVSWAYSRVSV